MADEDQNHIILFPEYAELKAEVEKLRTELSMLVLEHDELKYVECKNIEMAYQLALGALEYRIFEAQCRLLRLKRELELAQALRNRQENVVWIQIELQLDAEFAEYQQQLEDRVEKLNEAIERNRLDRLSEEEARELKRLYRELVKALHPDLHPDQNPGRTQLFMNAVTAYKNGDLETLRVIREMVGGDVPESGEDALLQLVKEKKRLIAMLQSLRENIAKIKSEYPYTEKELVGSPERIAARKAELEELLRRYEETILLYRQRLEEMKHE